MAGDFRTFHTFDLLGAFGLSTSTCCIKEDGKGHVIRDTTTTSMGVLPPILPLLGIGFDRRLRRARLRVEVESEAFVARGTIAVAFPLTSRP